MRRRTGSIGLAALLIGSIFLLFEVRFSPNFAMPRKVLRPDPAGEERYEACVRNRTDRATREALASADNPDVQGTMIRMSQKRALADCRKLHPERLVEATEPLRMRLFELRWRY